MVPGRAGLKVGKVGKGFTDVIDLVFPQHIEVGRRSRGQHFLLDRLLIKELPETRSPGAIDDCARDLRVEIAALPFGGQGDSAPLAAEEMGGRKTLSEVEDTGGGRRLDTSHAECEAFSVPALPR